MYLKNNNERFSQNIICLIISLFLKDFYTSAKNICINVKMFICIIKDILIYICYYMLCSNFNFYINKFNYYLIN